MSVHVPKEDDQPAHRNRDERSIVDEIIDRIIGNGGDE